MNNMCKLILIAVAAGAVAEAANNGGHFGEPVFAAAMAPRNDVCPELPKLCTGHAMLHGQATTLTYLCPEETKVPSTVHVTVTKTTTVTEADETGSVTSVSAVSSVTSVEPTTTTTLRSTATQYKTITVSKISTTVRLGTPASTTIKDEPLYTIQTSIPSSIPPTTSAFHYPTLSLPFTNGTTNGVFYSHSIHNSSLVAPTPYYPNSTTHSAYGTPTVNFARQLESAESSAALGTNTAGQNSVSVFMLFLGVMMAALVV